MRPLLPTLGMPVLLVFCFYITLTYDRGSVAPPLSITRHLSDGFHYLFLIGGKTQPWKPALFWWFLWGWAGLWGRGSALGLHRSTGTGDLLPPWGTWAARLRLCNHFSLQSSFLGTFGDALEWGCDRAAQTPLFKSALHVKTLLYFWGSSSTS